MSTYPVFALHLCDVKLKNKSESVGDVNSINLSPLVPEGSGTLVQVIDVHLPGVNNNCF